MSKPITNPFSVCLLFVLLSVTIFCDTDDLGQRLGEKPTKMILCLLDLFYFPFSPAAFILICTFTKYSVHPLSTRHANL